MREGIVVTREWYRDGTLFIRRDEPWDFDKYGAFGTVEDVYIYDDVDGLLPGVYELRLYIDGVPQFDIFTDYMYRSFVIESAP